MSLATRVAALATRIAAEFKRSEVDLSAYLAAGFTGTLTARRRGSTELTLTGSISRTAGTPFGASTSNIVLAQLPENMLPIATVSAAGRGSASGEGYSNVGVILNGTGVLSIYGHRSIDTAIILGVTYLTA